MRGHHDDDPLARRAHEVEELARRSHEKVAQMSRRKGVAGKLAELFAERGRYHKFYNIFARLLSGLKRITGMASGPLHWIGTKLGSAMKWSAFQRENGEFVLNSEGELIFAPRRLGISLAVVSVLLLALHMGLSAAYFYPTRFEELVYTTGKQEITTGELYQFTGCTSLPCSTEAGNGKFYEIETSWYFPHLFYPEENVYANVPQQDAACFVKGYGVYFRRLSAIHKSMQWYQKAYSVSCRPYTEEEKQRAVELGVVEMPSAGE